MLILEFKKFVLEKLGISEPSVMYSEVILKKLLDFIIEKSVSTPESYNQRLVIEYSEIKDSIEDHRYSDLWDEFPVIKFEIDLKLDFLTPRQSRGEFFEKELIYLEGWASGFGNRNWRNYSKIVKSAKTSKQGIISNIGFEMLIPKKLDLNDSLIVGKISDKLLSAIEHELNHSYEYYKRNIALKSVVRPERRGINAILSHAGFEGNTWKFPREVFDYWEDLTFFIYLSELHEVRANVQEIGGIIKRNPVVDLSELELYTNYDKMEKFSADEYLKGLIARISTWEKYVGHENILADRLKQMWIRNYEKLCQLHKQPPIISLTTLKKMPIQEFLNFWQKRLNFAGKRLKRKVLLQKYHFGKK